MIRYFTLAALAIAVAFGGLFASAAMSGAQAKKHHHRTKVCRHVTLTGKVKRWRCRRGTYCCSAEIWGYYGCGSKALGCFDPQ